MTHTFPTRRSSDLAIRNLVHSEMKLAIYTLATRDQLEKTNEKLEATNEKLEAANEQVGTINEQVGAINEQVGTINEQMGAIRDRLDGIDGRFVSRSEDHKSELQSLMRRSYAVSCLKHKKKGNQR